MAGHRDTKHNCHSRSAKAHRRAVGVSCSVGAFLAFGMTQLAAAPTVKADGLDAILDPIINSIASSLGDVAAGSAAVPELGLGSLSDMGSVAAARRAGHARPSACPRRSSSG